MRLSAVDLAIGYPGRPVGQGINLTVTPGETLALLGPNGGGKTTLFKTLLGLLPARGGRVTLEGGDIRHLSRARLARTLGYVPQAGSGYFPYTVLETVLMGRTARLGPFASPGAHDRTIALEALERLQMAYLAGQVFTRLSGGQRQLVLIARALAQEPRLLVMDEPTASLDFGNQVLVLEHIRRLAAAGIGVVLSTHDPAQALAVAGRVALLHQGGLLALGPPREVITPGNLRRLYGVEVELVDLPDGRRVCVPALNEGRSA